MLDLQQLRYFIAVAETENVGQAAELLHISQSPLSRQLQQLESRLGLTLFTREKKRLKLTPAGRDFLVEAKALLAHAERVKQRAADVGRGKLGTLVVGYVAGAVHAGVIGKALQALQQQVPGARLQLRSLPSAEQFAALQRGELDLGYTYAAPPVESGLASVLLLEEPFVLAVPADHALATAESLDLNGQPLVAPLSWPAREELLRACATLGWAPDVRYEAADPAAALGLVAAGLGCAFVQKSLVTVAGAMPVVLRELPATFTLSVQIHCVHQGSPSPLAHRLMMVS
ncbi:LysR substrate-binding domain-containing protein [Piscinibacter sp. HJYY11]|uniref:LysR substrate-binding domain-containing protein n=1 Tax=Piscinibacter sp. HJYY11 TaxID=2801333 RepID=UPI00191CD07E|nr:LysR substrate-binding domain-containing protein [Piscinibacter sp. HJYY11]MBL0729088.1 LysR family transcriptional regulator [Piscinibacter sp. HJYY11]